MLANSISVKRHRQQRFPFVAGIRIIALDTQAHVAAHIEDLNISGCFVETTNPFVGGTKVGLRISHDGVVFEALGTVAYSLSGRGMGITFTSIEPSSIAILDGWLTTHSVTE
ncbi:MAG TPA: PilZ domain-containing protein [Candidatus Acidoferrales bacterium]